MQAISYYCENKVQIKFILQDENNNETDNMILYNK